MKAAPSAASVACPGRRWPAGPEEPHRVRLDGTPHAARAQRALPPGYDAGDSGGGDSLHSPRQMGS